MDKAQRKRGGRDVLCLGETMLMLVPDREGPLEHVRSFSRDVGGAESNVAVWLARLGVSVAWAGRVGNDGFGRYLISSLGAAGVDVGLVEVDVHQPTGLYIKEVLNQQTNVHYYRTGTAASAMSTAWFQRSWLTELSILHLSGITPALSPAAEDLVWNLMTESRDYRLSFDVNWRPPLWKGRRPDILLDLARRADVVFVGLDEAVSLWGVREPKDVRRLLPEPEYVVVKHPPSGATVYGTDLVVSVPVLTVSQPQLHTVGAGDAFAAGFLQGLIVGSPVAACLRRGHFLGALALTVPGDVAPSPSADDVTKVSEFDDATWQRAQIVDGRLTTAVGVAR